MRPTNDDDAARGRAAPVTAPRGAMHRIMALLVLALLPVACASHEAAVEDADGTPVMAAPSQSLTGNYLAGLHAQSERQLGPAIRFLLKAMEQDPDNRQIQRRVFVLMALEGHFEDAVPMARTIVAEQPQASISNIVLVHASIDAGDYGAAAKRLAGLKRAKGMNTFLVPLLEAWVRVGQDDLDGARTALQALAKNKAFASMMAMHTGLIEEIAGNTETAIAAYLKAAESPNGLSLRLVEILGSLYERSGQPEAAKALYERYRDEHPTSQLIGPALKRIAAGGSSPRPVADAKDGIAEALFGVSNSIRQRTPQDAALIFGRLALALKPDFPLAQILVADILETENRLELANGVYGSIDPKSPFAWSARLSMAANLNRMDRTDEAVGQLLAMAEENPKQADSYINLGDILRGRDRFVEAVDAYDKAIQRIPSLERRHWTLLYARGIALERSKQWARAEADFLKALEFEPDQPYVLNYLGYSWVDRGRNLDRAKEMIRKAVELRPNDGYIVDSMGWVLYRLGDFKGAAKQLERAVELRPQDPVINDHLGDAYWNVERRQEARFQWRRALSLNPDADLRAVIRAKIERGPAPLGDAARRSE